MAGKKSRHAEANHDAVPPYDPSLEADQAKPEAVVETTPPVVENQTEASPDQIYDSYHLDDEDGESPKIVFTSYRHKNKDQISLNVPPAPLQPVGAAQIAPDAMARLHIVSQDVTTKILELTCDSKGLHMEAAIGILGALAGFSTSYAMVTRLVEGALEAKPPEAVIARLKSGDYIVFGEFITRKLVEGEDIAGHRLSLLHVIYEKAEHLAKVEPLDTEDLFARVAKTIGTPVFGVPDMPESCPLDELPETYVTNLFPGFLPILEEYDLPVDHYHLAFGLSAQAVMQIGKDIVSPGLSAKLFMECAVPMSYLDPRPLMPQSPS